MCLSHFSEFDAHADRSVLPSVSDTGCPGPVSACPPQTWEELAVFLLVGELDLAEPWGERPGALPVDCHSLGHFH